MTSGVAPGAAAGESRLGAVPVEARRLRVLHLILMLGETNSQYNEHCLPQRHELELSISTYFTPRLQPPPGIALFAGDGSLRGFFRGLRSALAGREYDAVHAHAPQTATLLSLLLLLHPRGRRLRRSSVYTVHDSYYDYKLRNKVLMFPAFVLFRRVVFCSHAAFDSYPRLWKRVLGTRARIVQNSADLDRVARAVGRASLDDRPAGFSVLSVGRLEPVKDPLTLLRAFRAVNGSKTRLTYVGAGSLEADLKRAIEAGPATEEIEMTGLIPRDDVFVRAAASDLYVSTSHGEGLPVAVMEVMAAGCPVVLSDIPPHREVADGARFIPLVPPDDTDGFAREIQRFRDMSQAELASVGEQCRAHVYERFALPRMHAGYEAIYRELRDEQHSGSPA